MELVNITSARRFVSEVNISELTEVNPKSFDNCSYQVFLSTLTALDGKHGIILMGEHSLCPGVNIKCSFILACYVAR